MQIAEWCKAVFYGILEGITEWLPVSSTGHLILLGEYLPFRFSSDQALLDAFFSLFEVVIQLGAVGAVVLLFWKRIMPFSKRRNAAEERRVIGLWGRVLLASIPAAVMGFLLDRVLSRTTGKNVDEWLFCAPVVAFSLIFYGVWFLFSGKCRRAHTLRAEDVSPLQALGIGAFQMLALIPGTSRSGATVLGAELAGLTRTAGAEFSFFMAIPVMLGAAGLKALDFLSFARGHATPIPADAWIILLIGCTVSFAVSTVAIRFLLDVVKRHGLAPFGVYRILLGLAVLLLRG